MGFCLRRGGRWDEGLQALCRVMPEPQARFQMARVLDDLNFTDAARQQLQFAVTLLVLPAAREGWRKWISRPAPRPCRPRRIPPPSSGPGSWPRRGSECGPRWPARPCNGPPSSAETRSYLWAANMSLRKARSADTLKMSIDHGLGMAHSSIRSRVRIVTIISDSLFEKKAIPTGMCASLFTVCPSARTNKLKCIVPSANCPYLPVFPLPPRNARALR